MTLSTPEENSGKGPETECKLARYLWILPAVTAAVAWGLVESLESYFVCACTASELVAVVVGALIGVFISNALRERFCSNSKDRRD